MAFLKRLDSLFATKFPGEYAGIEFSLKFASDLEVQMQMTRGFDAKETRDDSTT